MKKYSGMLAAGLMTLGLALGLSFLGFIWTGHESAEGQLTVMARITKNVVKVCRAYTENELRTIPVHMRQAQLCEPTAFPYKLVVSLDGKPFYEEEMIPQTKRGDHPMNLQKKIALKPGRYRLQVDLTPSDTWKTFVDQNQQKGLNTDVLREMASYVLDREIIIEAGRIIFATLNEDSDQFMMSEK